MLPEFLRTDTLKPTELASRCTLPLNYPANLRIRHAVLTYFQGQVTQLCQGAWTDIFTDPECRRQNLPDRQGGRPDCESRELWEHLAGALDEGSGWGMDRQCW